MHVVSATITIRDTQIRREVFILLPAHRVTVPTALRIIHIIGIATVLRTRTVEATAVLLILRREAITRLSEALLHLVVAALPVADSAAEVAAVVPVAVAADKFN